MTSTSMMMVLMSVNHQYSFRRARPLKSVYCFRHLRNHFITLRFQQEIDVTSQSVLLGILHLGLEDFHLVGLADELEFAVFETQGRGLADGGDGGLGVHHDVLLQAVVAGLAAVLRVEEVGVVWVDLERHETHEGYAGVQTFMRVVDGCLTAEQPNQYSLLELILSPSNLNAAYKQVMRNKGAAGVDRMDCDRLLGYLLEQGDALTESIRQRTYRPNPVRLNYGVGEIVKIKLTEEEKKISEDYEDFKEFIREQVEEKYQVRLKDCEWMTLDSYSERTYNMEGGV